MIEVTSKLVVDLWGYLGAKYDSKVVDKASAVEMKAVAKFLALAHIQDEAVFMRRFTTTVGRRIYIPFELGVENDYHDLWSQLATGVHEHQHIEQGDRDGWPIFTYKYLGSSSFRAGYEAEAYGCNLEMTYWQTGELPDIQQIVEGLRSYGCNDGDVEMAKQMLTVRAAVVTLGAVENRASRLAIEWLEKRSVQ